MKKMTFMVMALAMVLGLAQCKKEQPATPQNEQVTITLNVGGNNGTKANVNPNPESGDQVTFESGDRILVASAGKYVGYLEHTGSSFTGSITNPEEGQPLYFYFLGNKIDVETLTAGATEECTVNISDQSNYPHLPVISMGKSTVDYSSDETSYTSRLYNKCSLMKFVVTTPSTAAICITGMNNEVTVDFSNPTDGGFEYGMNTEDGGLIKMPAKDANNETWAIVLPQDVVEACEAYTDDGAYTGTRPAIEGGIEINKFLDGGFALEVTTSNNIIDLSTVTSPITVTDGKVLINTLGVGVQISIADGATVTLQDANINGNDDLSGSFHGIQCLGDATIVLEGDNKVKAKNISSISGRAGIFVPRYKKLIIRKGESDGMLDVAGAGIAAGIGGYMNNYSAVANGAIEIQSGKMTVTAGSGVDNMMYEGGSAGIGSCPGGKSDAITITKGNLIVYGAKKAAAIGTGATGFCKQEGDGAEYLPAITINIPSGRGWVKAYKGTDATYIIGGGVPNKCGVVTVHNHTYEDGDGNHGITGSTTSQSPAALDIFSTYILYMP